MTQSSTALVANGNTDVALGAAQSKAPLAVRMELSMVEAAIAHYPADVQPDVLWLHNFRHTEFSGRTALLTHFINERLGMKASEQYVYQLLAGKYFRKDKEGKLLGSVDTVREIAAAARNWAAVNADACGLPFVEDVEWQDFCDYIVTVRNPENVVRFGGIVGATGRGKTRMVRRYCILHNHGNCVRIEAGVGMTVAKFEQKLGWCYGVPFSANSTERRERIYTNVRRDRTIFVENVQKLHRPQDKGNQRLFSWLQELQDETQCSIVMTWTPGFTRILTDAQTEEGKYFEQFVGRLGGMDSVHQLDAYRPTESLRQIAEKFALGGGAKAVELLKKWSRQPGRDRIMFRRLQLALVAAKADGAKRVALEHLQAADLQPVAAPADESEVGS